MTDNNLDNVNPPIAKQEALIREFHGRSFVDEYEWMRNKESQDTLDHLNAENTYRGENRTFEAANGKCV